MARLYHLPPDLIRGPESDVLPMAGEANWGVAKFKVDLLRQASNGGAGVITGICDTGVDRAHPDLRNCVAAKDFTGSPIGAGDRNEHGTHCTGTVGATNPNIGMAPNCKTVHGKCLSDAGSGAGSWIAAAIRYCVYEQGAEIVSMSLGSSSEDRTITAAMQEVSERNNVWCVCAAGNSGAGTPEVDWPGRSPWCVSVAALNPDLTPASFSSAGAKIDTSFAGVNIWSARPGGGYRQMSGTCIAEGEYVYTPFGPRKIETMKAGDIVYAQKNGQVVQRVVQGVHNRGTNEVFRLIGGGRDVTATASHEMLSFNTRSREPEWVRLGQLREYHRLLIPRAMETQVNPYLDTILTQDFCWLMGFFTGDGWVSYTNRSARMNFASGDKPEVIAKVERIYKATVGKSLKQNKQGSWHYDDCSRMAMIVDSLGLAAPANEKTVPMWLWSLSAPKQMAFYEGYRAADGHVHKAAARKGITDSFECVAGDLVRRLACFADYQGWKHSAMNSRIRFGKAPSSKEAGWNRSHTLTIYRNALESGWTQATGKNRTEDAEAVAKSSGIDPAHYSTSTYRVSEESRSSNVYDLTVPDADCFITQGLVTHNSMATPGVAGVLTLFRAGLKAAGRPIPTIAELRKLLQSASTDTAAPGVDRRTGPGWVTPILLALNLAPDPLPVG